MLLHTYRGLSIYLQSICLQREDTDSSLEAAPSQALYTYAVDVYKCLPRDKVRARPVV